MSEVLVSVDHVSKKFCRSLKQGMMYAATDVARDTIGLPSKCDTLRKGEFWSVKDVTFNLHRGECLGLIGANGAGKSTLLKMINGIIRPDTGSISMRGRVGALIEVGAGFHPMLTGKENVYVNGAILGMSAREISKNYDSIVAFSGLQPDVLDAPVKTYSSGMYVRLGFAVAAHSQPDTLLVDEILAVGDLEFQSQCWRRIHALREAGTTIVLVSHSGLTIREVCDKALWVHQGEVRAYGEVDDTVKQYERWVPRGGSKMAAQSQSVALPGYKMDLRFMNGDGAEVETVECGDPFTAEFTVETPADLDGVHLLLEFYAVGKPFYTSYCTEWEGLPMHAVAGQPNVYRVEFPQFNLPVGEYLVSAVVGKDAIINHCVWSLWGHKIVVAPKPRLRGDMHCDHTWGNGAARVVAGSL